MCAQPGEILLRGPSITRGYYNNPEATARLAAGDGFIHSGDLGYLDPDGNLYIAGRLKDIIIHAGRNIAPREAEEILDGLAFVRQCAALGIDKDGMEGEQVYLFAEVRAGRRWPAEMAREIVQRFYRHFGFRPGRVYLVSPHGIPRTANGKLRHSLLKERYLQGKLREEGLILYPDY
ncbi:MAG: acyl--CoA ligase [Gammaproteobacteria bacterium]|nr:acyl--CoA ligase [Gammaproteobacteria bacterium]